MAAVTPAKAGDRKLQLKEVLEWMVEDGLLDAPTAAKVLSETRAKGGIRHPVTSITEARLRALKAPHAQLTGPVVTEWLAARLKIPFFNIDPLKIDLKNVTAVMSADYAQKRGILPVEVSGKDVTIAVSVTELLVSFPTNAAHWLATGAEVLIEVPISSVFEWTPPPSGTVVPGHVAVAST